MPDNKKLYALEAEYDTGWHFDDMVATDLADMVMHLNRARHNCPNTNFRIGKYERVKTIVEIG